MKRILLPLLVVFLILSTLPSAAEASSASNTLISNAKSHMGTPYKWGGTTPSGFDCSGFMQYVFKQSGISLPRTTGEMNQKGSAVSKGNLEAGDLVFFNTSGKGVSHAGIYIGDNNFIHASSSKGVMVSSINDPYYWGSKYIGAKRVHDFADKKVVQTAAKPASNAANQVSRLEIAETLAKELGLSSTYNGTHFSDIYSTHPKIKYINAMYEAGIFTGSNGKFNPNEKLSRAQMAKVLVEAFELKGKKNPGFKDVGNHWSKGYIEILYFNGITTGYLNGNYGINDKVTNGQFGKFMDRASVK